MRQIFKKGPPRSVQVQVFCGGSCVLGPEMAQKGSRGMGISSIGSFQRRVLFILFSSQCILCLVLEHGHMPVGNERAYVSLRSRLPCWPGLRLRGGSSPFDQLLSPGMMSAVDKLFNENEEELARMMGFSASKSAATASVKADNGDEKVRETFIFLLT